MAAAISLRAEGIVKAYAGVRALDDVSLTVRPGEVLGLVGHNGAGKSTLLKVLSGAVAPDSGHVAIDGVRVEMNSPAVALAHGISTVYQELSLLPGLTITQNVFLGRELRRGRMLDRGTMRTAAAELIERFGLQVDVDERLGAYPVATRQLLEIAIATQRGSRFLLLDEPTTSLEGEQVSRLLDLIGSLAADGGFGIMLVDHKLDELYAVAHSVLALVDGKVRLEGPVGSVERAAVVEAITGEEAASSGDTPLDAPMGSPTDDSATEAALVVRDLHTTVLRGADLEARAGRVLGLYGLVGAGRTELMRALVGLDPLTAGTVRLFGEPYVPRDPAAASRAGLVYLTEERKIDGIVPLLDSATNVALPVLSEFTRGGVLDKTSMRTRATELMDTVRVRGNRAAGVGTLSGGNQQKVLIARALAQRPKLLLLDEPTKGVDIGVKAELHRLVRRLARDEGLTVVMASSEEEEVLEVADEVAIFAGGRRVGDVRPAGELTAADLRAQAWEGRR